MWHRRRVLLDDEGQNVQLFASQLPSAKISRRQIERERETRRRRSKKMYRVNVSTRMKASNSIWSLPSVCLYLQGTNWKTLNQLFSTNRSRPDQALSIPAAVRRLIRSNSGKSNCQSDGHKFFFTSLVLLYIYFKQGWQEDRIADPITGINEHRVRHLQFKFVFLSLSLSHRFGL